MTSPELAIGGLSADAAEIHMDSLLRIGADMEREYWRRDHFLLPLPGKWELSLAAWKATRLIGYAIVSAKGPNHAHLHHFAIAPEFRGQGIGRALLAQMEKNAARQNYRRVTLKVTSTNTAAIRFYGRLEYRVAAFNGDYFMMEKVLPCPSGAAL